MLFYVSFVLTCIPGLDHLFYTAIVLSTENFAVLYYVSNLLFLLQHCNSVLQETL